MIFVYFPFFLSFIYSISPYFSHYKSLVFIFLTRCFSLSPISLFSLFSPPYFLFIQNCIHALPPCNSKTSMTSVLLTTATGVKINSPGVSTETQSKDDKNSNNTVNNNSNSNTSEDGYEIVLAQSENCIEDIVSSNLNSTSVSHLYDTVFLGHKDG